MRRSSVARLQSQTSEPLIVVEDQEDKEEDGQKTGSSQQSSEEGSPTMNPYLLSPYTREIRKHSLPTPQCSGITASQVRRLSERGESGPGPRQAEFLATLSAAPQVSPGGRRHSVVTISKLPSTPFGRSRRESVAAFPSSGFPNRILPNRRESIACPPSTESRGSVHNLQLDIMDDIVQARKVRMKVWTTSSEKLCEVQPLDDATASSAGVQRYTNPGRRFSEFVGTMLPPIPSAAKRRTSELPPVSSSSKPKSGIVCTNTDLCSILSSLSTSATEINQWEKETSVRQIARSKSERKLKSGRWAETVAGFNVDFDSLSSSASGWFAKRHQPKADATKKPPAAKKGPKAKVMWDGRSGSLIDPHALGSAIEGFLRQSTPDESPAIKENPSLGSKLAGKVLGAANRVKATWFSKGDDEPATDTCDSSICSTLKDLFVK
ncbi:uncharacterized protein LOC132701288 [Cylas formicarius]|uniref:uncharacterized protein LOC132701288 n=1 Tax=Cylas formicarius TaxID=197179 RepID=UPI0029588B26|nr:uncharacterized protein LOC132701288 [Cylas formicarius]